MAVTGEPPGESAPATRSSGSLLVAIGILASRVAGLVRQRVFNSYFGTSLWADAFNAGFRVPNVLQNLLGDGTLSASFIPVYAELLEQGRKEEAGRVAGAVFALLVAIAGGLAAIGVLAAPLLVDLLAPGWTGEAREATIAVVRVLFPTTGVLVLSAWALGILNSHRRFLTSYTAPVASSVAIIATFLVAGSGFHLEARALLMAVAWGALVGGGLQLAIQLPEVLRLERSLKIRWDLKLEGVRETVANAGPAIVGRGVVQLSSYLDTMLASFLTAGALSSITNAQTLYLLPVSLFGMSVAAAELPELARTRQDAGGVLRIRTSASIERVAFFVVPTVALFAVHGGVVVAALFQTGKFSPADTIRVWATLGGYTVGLLATTTSRVLSSAFYALRDTRTPARFAVVRVLSSAVFGLVGMGLLEPLPDLGWNAAPLSAFSAAGLPLGVAGLTLGAGLGAWVEWSLLWAALSSRIGRILPPFRTLAVLVGAAAGAAAVGWGADVVAPIAWPIGRAVVVCGAFGATYLGITAAAGVGESRRVAQRLRRRLGR